MPGVSLIERPQLRRVLLHIGSVSTIRTNWPTASPKIVGRHTLSLVAISASCRSTHRTLTHGSGDFNSAGIGNRKRFCGLSAGRADYFVQTSDSAFERPLDLCGAYFQDSVKLTSELDGERGLRWEVGTPWADTKGRVETIIPGEQSKLYPDSPRGLGLPGRSGVSPGMWPTKEKNFGPRVGRRLFAGIHGWSLGQTLRRPRKDQHPGSLRNLLLRARRDSKTVVLGQSAFRAVLVRPNSYLEAPYAARNGVNIGQRFPFVQAPPRNDRYLESVSAL